jgi:predicted enzyme related to lactoylglutathione lyase
LQRLSKESAMGQPVVHFEIIGLNPKKLQSYYSELFGWKIDTNNPANYGIVSREGNTNSAGVGIGGGIGYGPAGYPGHVTFYVEVPDVEAALAKAEALGGKRTMGPEMVMEGVEVGMFNDPEGHVVGLVKSA